MENVVSMTPWISVIGSIIGWTFFLIALAMLKQFFSHGFSVAVAEFLLNHSDEELRARCLRWFGNGEAILKQLHVIEERFDREKRLLEERKK